MTGPGPLQRLFPHLGARTHLMGVLNVTPDSFSDGGRSLDPEAALDHALAMMDAGADLIDVGGESTRPGAAEVPAEEERRRVLPVITRLAKHRVGPISIDTTKASVAEAALDAGAALVNDISGLSFDPALAPLLAARRVPVIVMHTRGRPAEMQQGVIEYPGGVVAAVTRGLEEAITRACRAGIAEGAIIVDPGIGFGKTVEHNVELLARIDELRRLGAPILVGPSRKSFLGILTGRPVGAREFGTAAVVAWCTSLGVDFVRVHDLGAMGDVVRVCGALRAQRPLF